MSFANKISPFSRNDVKAIEIEKCNGNCLEYRILAVTITQLILKITQEAVEFSRL